MCALLKTGLISILTVVHIRYLLIRMAISKRWPLQLLATLASLEEGLGLLLFLLL